MFLLLHFLVYLPRRRAAVKMQTLLFTLCSLLQAAIPTIREFNWLYLTFFLYVGPVTALYTSLSLTEAHSGHRTSNIYIFDGTGFCRQERLAATDPLVLPWPFAFPYECLLRSHLPGICLIDEGTATYSICLCLFVIPTGPFFTPTNHHLPPQNQRASVRSLKKLSTLLTATTSTDLTLDHRPLLVLTPVCRLQRPWRTIPALSRPCLLSCLSTSSATCLCQKMFRPPSKRVQPL